MYGLFGVKDKEGRDFSKGHSAGAIAIATTSNANFYTLSYVYRLMLEGEKVYYMDTDSIYTSGKLSTGEDMGEFKLLGEYDIGYFLAPKVYVLKEKDNIEVVAKGTSALAREMVKQGFKQDFQVQLSRAIDPEKPTIYIPQEDYSVRIDPFNKRSYRELFSPILEEVYHILDKDKRKELELMLNSYLV
mgnify:CR=1 FL=1